MAEQPNISQILAALAAQRPNGSTPQNQPQGMPQAMQQPYPPPQMPGPHQTTPAQYQAPYAQPYPTQQVLPAPINSGSIDISNIKPVNSGSVNFSDGRSRGGLYGDRSGNASDGRRGAEFRNTGSSYRPSRSRSRSPPMHGREAFRDDYNPYREDRRGNSRQNAGRRDRQRSFSPNRRDSQPGNYASQPSGADYNAYADKFTTRRVEDNSEIISINSNLVGLIIGRAGENLRRVETDTKTRVQFVTPPNAGVVERECRITGTPKARAHAKAEILRIVQESGKDPGPPSNRPTIQSDRDAGAANKAVPSQQQAVRMNDDAMQMMVPNRTVGLIIGKGGETIRDLQERSRCHVNILGEDKSVNGLRPVNLIGTVETARRAKDLIMQIVESDANGGPIPIGSGRDADPIGGTDGDRHNDRIFVPSESVGMIIGKGGETIKDMQNATGCKINVSPATGRDIEREIGLIGSRISIERAKGAIQEKVRAVHDKNRPAEPRSRGPNPAEIQPSHQQAAPGSQAPDFDPYAAYGGYQNYLALWYSSLQTNAGQSDPQAQGPQGA